jgi:hypothetical protein
MNDITEAGDVGNPTPFLPRMVSSAVMAMNEANRARQPIKWTTIKLNDPRTADYYMEFGSGDHVTPASCE